MGQARGLAPPGVTFKMGGLYAEQQGAFRDMALVFAAAVAAVFILLLLIYESFRTALCILLMPLVAASADAIGLWLTGVELNIMALMGATMILGITTEVAIFYFTEYESLLAEGMAPEEALIQAGINRLRPIAMTTLAAILALAPLALALGGGASMERPLAIAIIAGLIAQGPLVLLAMPAIYKLMGGLKNAPPAARNVPRRPRREVLLKLSRRNRLRFIRKVKLCNCPAHGRIDTVTQHFCYSYFI